MRLNGLGVSDGIGIGRAILVEAEEFDVTKRETDPVAEEKRFSKAIRDLMHTLEEKAGNTSGEQAEILESHIDILEDPMLTSAITDLIEAESCNSEYASTVIFDQYIEMFASSGDELLELRASDLKDIKNNLLSILAGKDLIDVSKLPSGTILVAEELTTSIAAGINPENICGIVTEIGGKTSHMAIIARSIGVPAIVGVSAGEIANDTYLIMDGSTGVLLLEPSKEEIDRYTKKQEAIKQEKLALEKYRGQDSVTEDGQKVELFANIGLEIDIENAVKADAEGVGLFRTEFLYMNRGSAPGEEEQFQIYKKAATAFPDKPVIIRTLDIGGDKEIPYLELEKEENPFLGWRAIRYCLDKEEIFISQIRAILRASAFGDIKIMIPMISTLSEFERAKKLIVTEQEKLLNEGIPFNQEIQVGIMVETPAAGILADLFAETVDFFSIGTNDLTQYTMAVDRGNKKVADLYSPYNPAVLRLIYQVAQAAQKNNIMCGVCGEAGGDPLMMKYLIGCGINELSMTGTSILKAREIVRSVNYKELESSIQDNLFNLHSVDEVLEFLKTL